MRILAAFCLLASTTLLPCPAQARIWIISKDGSGDAPTIQAGIDSAAVGDSVILEGGTWHVHDINMKAGIYLGGVCGASDCVTIDADGLGRCISCVSLSIPTTVNGLIFRGGVAPAGSNGYAGGAMYISESSVTVADCRFETNYAQDRGGAVSSRFSIITFLGCVFQANSAGWEAGAIASGSDNTTLTDCVFMENSASDGGAISSGSVYMGDWSSLHLSGCLFLRNEARPNGFGGAVKAGGSTTVTNCTFADNSGRYGSAIWWGCGHECTGGLDLTNTIFSHNTINCTAYYNQVDATCCNLWYSSGGGYIDCVSQLIGTSGNFSLNPQFCDTANDNYTLKQCSPCAPGNHPDGWDCGLIGAFPVGCPGTAVESTTWGRLKALFR